MLIALLSIALGLLACGMAGIVAFLLARWEGATLPVSLTQASSAFGVALS